MTNTSRTTTTTTSSSNINGETVALLAALSNPSAKSHTEALQARDVALSQSNESYTQLVLNFGRILGCISSNNVAVFDVLRDMDPTAYMQLEHDPTMWRQYRQMAGLLLKNAIVHPPFLFNGSSLSSSSARFRVKLVSVEQGVAPGDELKHVFLQCLMDDDAAIRNVAGSCIAAMVTSDHSSNILPLDQWPSVFQYLIACLKGEHHQNGVNGALNAIVKLCEDAPETLNSEVLGKPLNQLIPLFLQYFDSPDEKHRTLVLQCINFLIEIMPAALVVNINAFLAGLSKLATDPNSYVRQQVCRAIVSLLSLRTEFIEPHLASVSEFMLTATSDKDASVALDACEFWLTFASLDDEQCSMEMTQIIRSLLPRIIPVLLNNMIYSPEKIEEILEQNTEDENESPDRIQDLAPVFHKSRQSKGEPGDDEDDDVADNDDGDNEWSLRKCAAASLDVLAGVYGPVDVLPPLLPALQEGLQNDNQWVREASILALGAISDGCLSEMEAHLPQLYPYLISQLSMELPQLRCIACWTISRYGEWIYEQAQNENQPSAMVRNLCEAVMTLIKDKNKKVQVAACSAFGCLVESCSHLFVPYLEPIYQHLIYALSIYRTKSQLVLFDTIGAISDYIGEETGSPHLTSIYIPPLINIWLSHHDPLDRQLLPLIESVACIAARIGNHFQPWALQVFDVCLSTIEKCRLSNIVAQNAYDEIREEDFDHIVCSADVIDGLVEGLGDNFSALLESSKFHSQFLPVLHSLCSDTVPGVRMSAFAMLGDIARKCPSVIEPALSELLKDAMESIDPLHPSVCNNATWAIGEICVQCGKNPTVVAPFSRRILEKLIPLVMGNSVDSNKSSIPGLTENAAATIGRLARVDPTFVKDDLARFLHGWCEGLASIADACERRDAFEGLLLSIQSNPQAVMTSSNRSATVSALILAIVSWHVPRDENTGVAIVSAEMLYGPYAFLPFPPEATELAHSFHQLLNEIKSALGSEWGTKIKIPTNIRKLLADSYKIT